jgi:hypothetical protein
VVGRGIFCLIPNAFSCLRGLALPDKRTKKDTILRMSCASTSQQLELAGKEDALGNIGDSGVDSAAVPLPLLALLPQVAEGHREDLDELVVLEVGLGVLILGQGHVNGDVDHAEVGVAEARVVEHDGGGEIGRADVARLLAQLANSGFLRRLAGIDEARGHLDADHVDGGAVLALDDELGTGGLVEDSDDADAVNIAVGWSRAALSRLPGPGDFVCILIGESVGEGGSRGARGLAGRCERGRRGLVGLVRFVENGLDEFDPSRVIVELCNCHLESEIWTMGLNDNTLVVGGEGSTYHGLDREHLCILEGHDEEGSGIGREERS